MSRTIGKGPERMRSGLLILRECLKTEQKELSRVFLRRAANNLSNLSAHRKAPFLLGIFRAHRQG